MKTITCDLSKGHYKSFESFLVTLGLGFESYGWDILMGPYKKLCRVIYIKDHDSKLSPQMGHLIKIQGPDEPIYGLIWDTFGHGEHYRLTAKDPDRLCKLTRNYKLLRRTS